MKIRIKIVMRDVAAALFIFTIVYGIYTQFNPPVPGLLSKLAGTTALFIFLWSILHIPTLAEEHRKKEVGISLEGLHKLWIVTVFVIAAILATARYGINIEGQNMWLFAAASTVYFILSIYFELDAKIPLLAGAVITIGLPVLVVEKMDVYAETLSIYIYYLLLTGSALKIIENRREEKK